MAVLFHGSAEVRRRILAISCLAALLAGSSTAGAQQFGTDDAALVAFRACQLEAWHGETETRIEPACQLIRNFEITAGFGFSSDDGRSDTAFLMEGKYALREPEPGGIGLALLAGFEVERPGTSPANRISTVYSSLPVSVSFGEDRLILHGNLGWKFENAEEDGGNEEGGHDSIWGTRADLLLPLTDERLTLIGEAFGTHGVLPEYQIGLRYRVVRDRLLLDLSWGGNAAAGASGLGWVVGLAWTPPPLF